ncbi:hypothetical protein ACQVUC_27660, partial [Bacillus paranthracis]|uniref:hypothetical protein n=1 Tax=Bacillus paranthracis TaxID=2026186 RepID=UPI003D6482BA
IKDNKKLRGKTAFCIKIYVKLMDVGEYHIAIMLTKINYTKLIFLLHMLKNMEQKPENEKIYTELEVYIVLYIYIVF